MKKFLICYYSRSGSTEKIAKQIADVTDGTLFEIFPNKPYSKSFPVAAMQAAKEKMKDARPPIVHPLPDVTEFTDVIIGYPAWAGSCPKIILTFLDEVDLKGKQVYLFNTHLGSGSVGTEEIEAHCAGDVHPSVAFKEVTDGEIRTWLNLKKEPQS